MAEPWSGSLLLSFRVSDDVARVIDVVARHEGRSRSGLIRRALVSYLESEDYLKTPALDTDGSLAREMVTKAREELERGHN